MSATRLIVLRHGETEWNIEGRYQGHLDSPLTSSGLAQARALASRLAAYRFGALYSSDLGRARQTAEIIAEKTGHSLRIDPRLRERCLGSFQGLLKADLKSKFPNEYRLFKTAGPDYVVPGGESDRQRSETALSCLAELARRHPDEQIAIVTHGGVVSALLRHALNIPLEAPGRFARPNAGWNVFAYEEGKWSVQTWGDVSHLDDI